MLFDNEQYINNLNCTNMKRPITVTALCLLMAFCVPAMGQSSRGGSKDGEQTEKKVDKGPKRKSNKLQKYQTFVYTSDDLSDEIERQVVADRQALSRGLGADLLSAGLSAATGAATGYISTLVEMGITAITKLIQLDAQNKKEWQEMVKEESELIVTMGTIADLNDFYSCLSEYGPMDPRGMRFNGIGCLAMEGEDTTFYISCHINRKKIDRIVRHSKFELVMDTFMINPYKAGLPNTDLPLLFTYADRKSFDFTMKMRMISSWMDQLPDLHKDQILGEFMLNVPVDSAQLDENNMFRYFRKEGEAPAYGLVGESFIVPRSYMPTRDEDGKYAESWGTGQYKMEVEIIEVCGVSEEFKKNWRKDFKKRKKMTGKMSKGEQEILQIFTNQQWDKQAKQWVATTLKGPASILNGAAASAVGTKYTSK